jgi:hypothetical protein
VKAASPDSKPGCERNAGVLVCAKFEAWKALPGSPVKADSALDDLVARGAMVAAGLENPPDRLVPAFETMPLWKALDRVPARSELNGCVNEREMCVLAVATLALAGKLC